MFKIALLALLTTPDKYLQLSDGYAVRTSDINAIARSFCANPNLIRSQRWQLIQPQVAELIHPQIERRVRLGLNSSAIEERTRQDQIELIDAIATAVDRLCP